MATKMLIGQSTRLMGTLTMSTRHQVFGWMATAVMAAAVALMFWTL